MHGYQRLMLSIGLYSKYRAMGHDIWQQIVPKYYQDISIQVKIQVKVKVNGQKDNPFAQEPRRLFCLSQWLTVDCTMWFINCIIENQWEMWIRYIYRQHWPMGTFIMDVLTFIGSCWFHLTLTPGAPSAKQACCDWSVTSHILHVWSSLTEAICEPLSGSKVTQFT